MLRPHATEARAAVVEDVEPVLAWLLYAAITQEAYRVVHCVAIADAEGNVRRWLRDELAAECDTPTHGAVVALAYAVLVGFGALVPLVLLVRMRRDRVAIRALIAGEAKAETPADRFARARWRTASCTTATRRTRTTGRCASWRARRRS